MIDLADVKPGLVNFFLFGLWAMIVIPVFKFFFAKFPVPGLSQLAGSI